MQQQAQYAAAAIIWLGAIGAPILGEVERPLAYVYTAAPAYDSEAWARGLERFPESAAVRVAAGDASRALAPGFYASADPEVSFDGRQVLFAGKQRREDPWQIWEAPAAGGTPRRLTAWPEDSIRPLYLPDNKIVYARKSAQGYRLEVLALAGGQPLRITYAPGHQLTCAVLHDGRVLYEDAPLAGGPHELYTVYPDGSGVESYRCDHGVSRHAGRQMASRDIVFATARGFGRFTSANAAQVDAAATPAGEFLGPVAEVSPDEWLVGFRASARTPFGIFRFNPVTGSLGQVSTGPGVEPAILAARDIPLRFPSGLHDWAGANVLCLNVYTSKTQIPDGSIASVRLYGQGQALLGETAVETDGSFFLHVPSEQPLRIELCDRAGHPIAAEHGGFWMRRGEQRVCVGCHAGPARAPENAVPKVLLRTDVPVPMAGGSR